MTNWLWRRNVVDWPVVAKSSSLSWSTNLGYWRHPTVGNHKIVSEAFQTLGLSMPKITLLTFSVHICTDLLTSGRFITALPKSLVERYALKALPINLSDRPWPVTVVTVKNRKFNSGRRALHRAHARIHATAASGAIGSEAIVHPYHRVPRFGRALQSCCLVFSKWNHDRSWPPHRRFAATPRLSAVGAKAEVPVTCAKRRA